MDLVAILNRALHGTVNSVVQYIDIAAPYVPPGCEEDRETLRRLRDEEVATAARIRELIDGLDGVPKVGVFPYWNVDLNYLDLRYLARFASEHQEKVIAALEAGLESARDDARVHGVLKRALEEKRAHLETLREIGAREGPRPSEEEVQAAQPMESQHVPRAWSKN